MEFYHRGHVFTDYEVQYSYIRLLMLVLWFYPERYETEMRPQSTTEQTIQMTCMYVMTLKKINVRFPFPLPLPFPP